MGGSRGTQLVTTSRGTLAGVLLFAGLLGMPAPSTGAASLSGSLPPGSVTVDLSTVIRTLPPTFFGINYDTWWDNSQGSSGSWHALQQTPIKLVRYPGGVAGNWSDWAEPYFTGYGAGKISSTSPQQLWNYIQHFGATGLFQTDASNHTDPPNPPNPPITAPGQAVQARQSYTTSSAQNQRDWVNYDRGQGIKAIMEVGNEVELELCGSCNTYQDPRYQPYIDTFIAQARAMHQADPATQVIGPTQANEWYWWNRGMLSQFLKQVGDKNNAGPLSRPDGISLHIYNGSTWSDTMAQAQTWLSNVWPNGVLAQITPFDSRALPVYITEWNNGGGGVYNATLGHGLVSADMIGAFASTPAATGQPYVAGEVYWDMHTTTNYGMLAPDDSPSPTYFAMALWGHMGSHVLTLTQRDSLGNPVDAGAATSAYATRRDDGSVQIMIINKQSGTQPEQFAFNGLNMQGLPYKVFQLAGFSTGAIDPNVDRGSLYDGGQNPSPQSPLPGPLASGIVSAGTLSYSLPPYSVTVLDVGPGGGGATATPTTTPTRTPAPPSSTPTRTPVGSTATSTGTPVPPSATPTRTGTPADPTATHTHTPATPTLTPTHTPVAPTATGTKTPVAPTATRTKTPLAATATATRTATPTAAGTPRFAVVATVSPGLIGGAGTASISAVITATQGQLRSGIADIEVYDAAWHRISQIAFAGQDIASGASKTYTFAWKGPHAPGDYHVAIGVFAANWSPDYYWNARAAAITVR